MLLADWEIKGLCNWINQPELNMIYPFIPQQIKAVEGFDLEQRKVISYGLSSYGYDIRLSQHDFKIFTREPGKVVNPKKFDNNSLTKGKKHYDADGACFFILPAHTYALGVSTEHFNIPSNVTGVCLGKSTYARVGIMANVTPLEAGWKGYLTIEISNSSCADVRIYADEGIAQLVFHTGEQCRITYADRAGKYQDQAQVVTTSIV